MALPLTLPTDFAWPTGTGSKNLGPFFANGNVYIVGVDLSTAGDSELGVWWSADPNTTGWSGGGGAGPALNTISQAVGGSIASILVGDIIHIAAASVSWPVFGDIAYFQFDTSDNTWNRSHPADGQVLSSYGGDGDPAQTHLDIRVHTVSSAEYIQIGYKGGEEKVHGTNRQRTYIATWDDASWTVDRTWDDRATTSTQDYYFAGLIKAAGVERIHGIVWAAGVEAQLNTISTTDSISLVNATNSDSITTTHGQGTSFDDGTVRCRMLTGGAAVFEFDDAASPSTLTRNAAVSDFGSGGSMARAGPCLDGTDLYFVYARGSNNDLYYDLNDGTDVLDRAAGMVVLSVSPVFYEVGGRTVIGIIYNDNPDGNEYDEIDFTPDGDVLVTPAAVGSIASVVAPLVVLGSLLIAPTAVGSIAETVDPTVLIEWPSVVVTPSPADSIASAVDPTVATGSIVVTPAPADTLAGVVDPLIGLSSLIVTPTPADSIASVVDPFVVQASMTVTPTPADSIASVVDPVVATGPIVVTPAPADSIAQVVNPTVELGGLTVAVGTADSIASAIDPTVLTGPIIVAPTAAGSIATVVAPVVGLGSMTVAPTAVGTLAGVVDPTVLLGSLVIAPTPADSIATVVDPTVVVPTGVLVTPDPVGSIATTVDPVVLLGSIAVTPAAVGSIATVVDPVVATGSVVVTPAPADTIASVVDPVAVQASLVLAPAPIGTIAAVVDPTVATGPVTVTPAPADTIAQVVNPTVAAGGLTIVAGIASSIAGTVDPTVLTGPVTVTPAVAGTLAGVAGPTVALGSMVVTTAPASSIASVVDPTTLAGSLALTPTPADTIASVVDPAVATGPITVAPAPADTLAGVVAPTVVLGSIVVTPAAVGTIATTVDPTVLAGGNILVTPTPADTLAGVVDPVVVLGSLVVAPTPADTLAGVVDPTVATGPVTVTPAPADTIAQVVNPTVVLAGIIVAPATADSLASTVDPTVLLGSMTVAPTAADTLAGVVDPVVALGSIAVTPAAIGSIATTVDPTVVIGSGNIVVAPAPADTIASAVDPTVLTGPVTVVPAPADTLAGVVDPTVLTGSIVVAPAPADTIAQVNNPTVVLAGLIIAPGPADSIASTIDPTVLIGGSVLVTPAPAETIASVVDPAVAISGSLVIAPAPADTIATTVDPTVLGGISAGATDPGTFIEVAGFDNHGGGAADFERYDSIDSVNWLSTSGKFGGGTLSIPWGDGAHSVRKTILATGLNEGQCAFHYYADQSEFLILREADFSLVFYISIETGVVRVHNQPNTVVGTGTASISQFNYYHIELEWKLSQSGAGFVRVWVNSVLDIESLDINLGNTDETWAVYDLFSQGGVVADGAYRIDDLVFQSNSGARLEDGHRIWSALPTSDISSQFTPSAGGDNYALVNDTDPDQDATYVESTGADDRDVYGAAAPTVGGADTIVGVNVKALARRASGTGDIKLGGQIGLNTLLSAAQSPDGVLWLEQAAMLTQKPGGGAWTQAALDNFEPMAEATAAGVRITQVWYEVLTISFTRPDKPTITIDPITNIDALLNGSAFVPGEAGTHAASQWQVTLDTDFNFLSPVYDTGISASQLVASLAAPLTADIDYIARVRYQESTDHWSEWSNTVAFSTDGPPETPTVTYGSAEGDHIVWVGSTYVPGTGSAAHVQTRWQVALHTDTGFSSPIIDYTTAAPGELELYTAYGVTPFTVQYIARAQYQDENGIWSAWSAASSASPVVGDGQFYTAFAERPIGTDPSTDVVADWEEIIASDGSSTWVLTERNDATCRVVSRRVQQSGDNNSMDPIYWQGFPPVDEQIVFSRIIFDLTGTGGYTCIGDGSPDGLICRLSIGKLDEENFDNLDEWNIVRSGTGEWVLAPDRGHEHGSGAEHAGNQALSFETNSPENPNALIIWEGAGNQAVGSWVQTAAKKADHTGYWWESPVVGLAFAMDSGGTGYSTLNVHNCGLFATWVFQTHYNHHGPLFDSLEMFLNVGRIIGSTLSRNHHDESYEYVKASLLEAGHQQSYLALGTQWGPDFEGRQSFDPEHTGAGKVGLIVFACDGEGGGPWDHEGNLTILYDNVIICSANVVTVQQLPEDWRLTAETPSQPLSSTWIRATGLAGEPDVEMDFKGNAWPAITLELRNAEGEVVTRWDPPGGIWGGDVYLINAGGIGVGPLGGPAARLSATEPVGFLLLESGDKLLFESSGSLILV